MLSLKSVSVFCFLDSIIKPCLQLLVCFHYGKLEQLSSLENILGGLKKK